jgi:hypothetical protein
MEDSGRYREAASKGNRSSAFSLFCEGYSSSENDFATNSRKCPVVFFTYDGVNLSGLVRGEEKEFNVPLQKIQFDDGTSFSYYVGDKTMTTADVVAHVQGLIADSLRDVLPSISEVIIIPDSCTGFMPISLPQGFHSGGDEHIKYRVMPSIMEMSVKSTCQPTTLHITRDSADVLVVGDPDVPTFWNLEKLPDSADEAKLVAHILRTTPLLHEHATKAVVLKRMKKAKLIHLATHGSSVSGFLAFAGPSSSPSSSTPADDSTPLMYPEEVEQLELPQADLVVLSCCDCASDEETKKDDGPGMVAMARAFIRAGAQTVLTILWRTDINIIASVFMQFFYQFLTDGRKSSVALQKAIYGLRCFKMYTQYSNWSSYQFIGRDIVLNVTSEAKALEERLGKCPIFPRMKTVEFLENAVLKNPKTPLSDVQVLQGWSGMKPTRTAVAFIYKFHEHFTGGIFWINGSNEKFLKASLVSVKETLDGRDPSSAGPTLVVLHVFSTPLQWNRFEMMKKFLQDHNTHIIVACHSNFKPDIRPRDTAVELAIGPMSWTQSIQRFAYEVLKSSDDFTPTTNDQDTFLELYNFTNGSSTLTSVAAALLAQATRAGSISEFTDKVYLKYDTPDDYDLDDSACELVNAVGLDPKAKDLLFCLSLFPCSPIPERVLQQMLNLLTDSEEKARKWKEQLIRCKLLYKYPQAVIVPPRSFSSSHEGLFKMDMYCVSNSIATALWRQETNEIDSKTMALKLAYKTLNALSENTSQLLVYYLCGLAYSLEDKGRTTELKVKKLHQKLRSQLTE